MSTLETDADFEALLQYLKENRGFDFTGYKRPSLVRRIRKRMQAVGIEAYAAYRDHLEVHPDEFAQLFDTILVNVTAFYRDPPAWDFLKDEVVPGLLARKEETEPVRVWSAGCASGEEAYTLAMVLADALGDEVYERRVKIYATDVDEDALATARHAIYDCDALGDLPAAWPERYFEAANGRCAVRPNIRRGLVFGRLDLVQDAPISRLDLLVCRNTLMYLNAETQNRVLSRFHFSLDDGGILFVGRAELLLTRTKLFIPFNLKHRMFRKAPGVAVRERLAALSQAMYPEAASNQLGRTVRLRDKAFDTAPVAEIVVDLHDRLVLANDRARALFGLTAVDLGRPFRDLELSYQPVELRGRIQQACTERSAVSVERVTHTLEDGGEPQHLNVCVAPLIDNGTLLGAAVTFTQTTGYYKLEEDLHQSTQDLETTQEELQSANEELETANEELQSANEELETTNEELQSANEELETTNEELRSSNDQLQAMNLEMRERTRDFASSNAYLHSILFSLRAGAAGLDRDLRVTFWNEGAIDLWGFRLKEVYGRSFHELDIGLPVAELETTARDVLAGREKYRVAELDATDRRGKRIRCRVTCTPVLSEDNQIDGVLFLMEQVNETGNRS
ncbi:MAG: PAS domain-containing protein [Gammaproteobacteria bacterium]|nr:PAS domain-containing protein [Gammaproteobacteria bacterium]NIR84013.1 PAS domain-containing protein [Gammaproteobacteria bacterium]NIR89157.1 PAS domain-containing protein [Gammaproteobacteria bacterium]NIU04959.1 PAS domain-containing protein [Gammaproteobacteria bacterium]NIV52125.1 PAS domain-containing protein [Gammaproteobacteria bacterium]